MNSSNIFTDEEQETIHKLLAVSLHIDPIFSPELFFTLTSITPDEVNAVIVDWPELGLENSLVQRVLQGVFSNLVNFPHRQDNRVYAETGVTKAMLNELRLKLKEIGNS